MLEIEDQKKNISDTKQLDQGRIQTMLSFIHQNYASKLSLEDIAASASISKRECSRCFQNSIRQTPIEYLLEYRIEMAAKLLVGTSDSIADIAYETGFSSNAYFGKMFRKFQGVTPGKYRKISSQKKA